MNNTSDNGITDAGIDEYGFSCLKWQKNGIIQGRSFSPSMLLSILFTAIPQLEEEYEHMKKIKGK